MRGEIMQQGEIENMRGTMWVKLTKLRKRVNTVLQSYWILCSNSGVMKNHMDIVLPRSRYSQWYRVKKRRWKGAQREDLGEIEAKKINNYRGKIVPRWQSNKIYSYNTWYGWKREILWIGAENIQNENKKIVEKTSILTINQAGVSREERGSVR
jgi:hypothetical protein